MVSLFKIITLNFSIRVGCIIIKYKNKCLYATFTNIKNKIESYLSLNETDYNLYWTLTCQYLEQTISTVLWLKVQQVNVSAFKHRICFDSSSNTGCAWIIKKKLIIILKI